ncbi:MAG: DEAD/DEAH box helicase family protein, partial [Patescibacteria group bacterium]|nr:DEAD/DEAH box helicase family protein [Patescibacteria group bacterium]
MKYQTQKDLSSTLKEQAFDYGISKQAIPEYITDNLKYNFFDWQNNAFENLLIYQKIKEIKNPNEPTHLMFNMATGTGKTLLMAATILYYYKQGYRHFIFFVNQNNIVDKTENNFLDNTHTKYLFKEKIVIDDKTVDIKKVETFSDNPQNIEIKFTTIQKLYNDIHLERENKTTLDDLHKKNIVMLADEGHHLNADTKNKKGDQEELDFKSELKNNASEKDVERKGWEHTVIELILNKNGNSDENKNVLLEFTATIPQNEFVEKKYEDKTIYKFGLKKFLSAGYTKEINLISSTLNKKERVLQALLFQWYRHKIALKNGIPNFKPVILFRSKTIVESKADYEEFLDWIDNISSSDFEFLKTITDKIYESQQPKLFEMGKSRTEKVLNFIKEENINPGEIANWIKQSFKEKNVIITNSKTNKTKTEKTTEEQEKLLNSLEDKNNHIRAIFTVKRLTEGWDVLNLFDIVRLYEGRDEGKTKTGKRKAGSATTSEKQLIGRGVRYFPFEYKDKLKNKRKFDEDLKNEMRVLEELYFYSTSEHRYIDELKRELKKDGYIKDDRVFKTFSLKKEFQESEFYKNTKVWYNKQIDNPNRKKKTLDDIKKDFEFQYRIKSFELTEQEIDFEKEYDRERVKLQENELKTIPLKFKDIEKHIFLKAINIKAKQENSLFQFGKLKDELEIKGIEDLQKDKFLGNFDLKITLKKNMQFNNISGIEKLNLVLDFLDKIFTELKDTIAPKIGSDFIAGDFEKFFSEPKTKTINPNNEDQSVVKNKWFVLDKFYGTSEEQELIEFIRESLGNLEEKYKEIYLLRNEEVYKIYDFEKGRGFQPDFILFMKSKDKKEIHEKNSIKTDIYYQIFIEPKGDQFKDNLGLFEYSKEGWKEKFLKTISKKYGFNKIIKAENPNYRLIGLPFFNKNNNTKFNQEY